MQTKERNSKFDAYTNESLSQFNSAVTRLYLDGGEVDEHLKTLIIESGTEMTARKMW